MFNVLAYGYEQITNFLQGFIDNELNFNQEDTCSQNCEDYTKTKNVVCADKTMCTREKIHHEATVCNGDIYDCTEIESNDLDVCYSSNSNRRYDSARDSTGKVYGTVNGSCLTEVRVS